MIRRSSTVVDDCPTALGEAAKTLV